MNGEGLPFGAKVVRSDRKTLALQVDRKGDVTVRAPRGTDPQTIRKALEERKEWIEQAIARQKRRAEARPEPTAEELAALFAQARAVLPGKVRKYAGIMGVTPTRLTITDARTRFGSCSAKNAVSLSCRLMRYPEEAIDYVVVHELAHIRRHDHSPAFWAEVEKWMPDYKRRRALLKE